MEPVCVCVCMFIYVCEGERGSKMRVLWMEPPSTVSFQTDCFCLFVFICFICVNLSVGMLFTVCSHFPQKHNIPTIFPGYCLYILLNYHPCCVLFWLDYIQRQWPWFWWSGNIQVLYIVLRDHLFWLENVSVFYWYGWQLFSTCQIWKLTICILTIDKMCGRQGWLYPPYKMLVTELHANADFLLIFVSEQRKQ